MADASIKFQTQVSLLDLSRITIFDVTGLYSAANPTGYGTPNVPGIANPPSSYQYYGDVGAIAVLAYDSNLNFLGAVQPAFTPLTDPLPTLTPTGLTVTAAQLGAGSEFSIHSTYYLEYQVRTTSALNMPVWYSSGLREFSIQEMIRQTKCCLLKAFFNAMQCFSSEKTLVERLNEIISVAFKLDYLQKLIINGADCFSITELDKTIERANGLCSNCSQDTSEVTADRFSSAVDCLGGKLYCKTKQYACVGKGITHLNEALNAVAMASFIVKSYYCEGDPCAYVPPKIMRRVVWDGKKILSNNNFGLLGQSSIL